MARSRRPGPANAQSAPIPGSLGGGVDLDLDAPAQAPMLAAAASIVDPFRPTVPDKYFAAQEMFRNRLEAVRVPLFWLIHPRSEDNSTARPSRSRTTARNPHSVHAPAR